MPSSTFFSLVLVGIQLIGTAQAGDKFLADRHAEKKIECQACHVQQPPSSNIGFQTCLNCHGGSYEGLSNKVDVGDIAFHASHVGDVNCNECHQGHRAPRLMCNQCHDFSVEVP